MSNDKLKIYVTTKDDSSKRISLSPIEELSKDTANVKSKITIEPNNPVSYTHLTLPTNDQV